MQVGPPGLSAQGLVGLESPGCALAGGPEGGPSQHGQLSSGPGSPGLQAWGPASWLTVAHRPLVASARVSSGRGQGGSWKTSPAEKWPPLCPSTDASESQIHSHPLKFPAGTFLTESPSLFGNADCLRQASFPGSPRAGPALGRHQTQSQSLFSPPLPLPPGSTPGTSPDRLCQHLPSPRLNPKHMGRPSFNCSLLQCPRLCSGTAAVVISGWF